MVSPLVRLSDQVALSAFCLSLKQACTSVRVLIMQGGVVEEEDFNPNVFGLPMDESISLSSADDGGKAEAALTAAIQHCQSEAKNASGEQGLYDAVGLDQLLKEGLTPADAADVTQHFVQAAALVQEMEGQATTLTNSATEATAAPTPPGFDDNVNRCLLAPAPPRTVELLTVATMWPHFKDLLKHLLLACSITSVKDFASNKQWVNHFAAQRSGPVPRSACHYLCLAKTWGGSTSGDPFPLDGSTPDALLGTDASSSNMLPPWVVQRDMMCSAVLLPTASPAFPAGSLGMDIEMFLEQSVIAVCNWCQAMMMNSSRQRRRLRRGLEDWGNLYQHALNADTSPEYSELASKIGWTWEPAQDDPQQHKADTSPEYSELASKIGWTWEPAQDDPQGPLGTWVELETASNMLSHLLVGAELEMYQPKEYSMVYWYCASLFNSRKNAAEMLLRHMPQAPPEAPPVPANPKGGLKPLTAKVGKGKGAGQKAKVAEQKLLHEELLHTRRQQYTMDAVQGEAYQFMCQGLLRLLLGLQLAGAINDLVMPFNDASIRYEQRFSSFHAHIMRPDPLFYDTFVGSTDVSKHKDNQLLGLAVESFTMILAELKQLERVAVQNSLACTIFAKSVLARKEEAAKSELRVKRHRPVSCASTTNGFNHHKYYATVGAESATK
eukprot:gene13810-19726_t